MDEREFEQRWCSVREPVRRMAARRLNPSDVQDLMSDTSEVAWRKRDGGPSELQHWQRWVMRIASNKIKQVHQLSLRRPHDYRFAEDFVGQDLGGSGEDVADAVVSKLTGLSVLAGLPLLDQLIFFASQLDIEDAGPEVIAGALGLSLTACASRKSRLRSRLREV